MAREVPHAALLSKPENTMSTRSLTVLKDGEQEICRMYRQCDGYPSGLGQELATFLTDLHLTNGISMGKRTANGMGCLAAQIVSHFKSDFVGSVYLHPAGTNDVGEEYIYTVYDKDGKIFLKCEDACEDTILFDGLPKDFDGEEIEREMKDE
jgi:hypothetical protein